MDGPIFVYPSRKEIIPMRKILAILLAVCTLLALTACGKKAEETVPTTVPTTAPTTKPTTAPTTKPTEAPTTAPTEPGPTDPLTGETVKEDLSQVRPYAVMINNIDVAQPQCGISKASMIFEVPVEGYITRMLALYTDISDAGKLGSMRSARPCFVSICRAYDSIFVHAGGSNKAYYDLWNNDIDRMDGVMGGSDAAYFYRDPSRQAYGIEHSMFIDSEDVLKVTDLMGYRTTLSKDYPGFGLRFTEDPVPKSGTAASYIDIDFRGGKHSKLTLEKNGLYSMDQYGDDYIDGNTDEEVLFKNVLILRAEMWDGYDAPDESTPRVYMTLTGEGTGYFACGGKMENIYWTRADEDSPFQYFLDEGHTKPLSLGVGTSYVAFISEYGDAPYCE